MNDLEAAIARCDREIEEMLKQEPTAPCLADVTLGILDWEDGEAYDSCSARITRSRMQKA